MSSKEQDRLFGEIALDNGMITDEMLEECLVYQEEVDPDKVLGQILLEKGYLTSEQIDLVLKIQNTARTTRDKKWKEMLVRDQQLANVILDRGFAAREEIEECVRLQQKMRRSSKKSVPLGEILLRKKYLTHSHLEIAKNLISGGEHPEVAGYKILGKLSKGGMGYLYKARQLSMDRIVALKVLDPKLGRNDTHVRRFIREAQTVAKFNHENMVGGIDVGEHDGKHYFVMEYVNGESVLDVIKREGHMTVTAALDVIRQVAEALHYASRHHIIHRDVKPSNILINHRNTAKVCDLGFAKTVSESEDAHLTIEGLTLGTPYYMSPEQAKGLKDLDIRTDIYALGATVYHMIVGRVPFTGRSSSEVMKKHLQEELHFPAEALERIPAGVVQLIEDMMVKDRDARIPDYKVLLSRIEPFLAEGEPSGASTITAAVGGGQKTVRILIICQTRTGATVAEGQWIAGSARKKGASVDLVRVEEVDIDLLVEYDAIVVGSPSYFGSASHEIKEFFETSERVLGQLDGKLGCAWISRENLGIGRDRALFDIVAPMLYHGMLVRGDFNHLFASNSASLEGADKIYEQNCRKLGERLHALAAERRSEIE